MGTVLDSLLSRVARVSTRDLFSPPMRVSRRRRTELPPLVRTVRHVGLVLTGVLLVFLLMSAVLFALAPERLETPANVASVDEMSVFFEKLVATRCSPTAPRSIAKELPSASTSCSETNECFL